MTDGTKYSFDGWTVDLRSGELSRDGHIQRLPPQPLAMLAELLAHPGEVVPRDRMVKVLWPTGIVDFDNSLNAVVRKLRVALREDAVAPRYVETLPRIGFRFIGTLAQLAAPEAPPPHPPRGRSTRLLVAVSIVAVTAIAGIAVWWFGQARLPAQSADAASTASPSPARSTNERAQELYLQARYHVARRDIDGTDLAIASLEAALREDPHFAQGWAALAEAWSGAGMTLKVPVSEAYGPSRRAALRSMELDGESSSAHAAFAHILAHHDRDFGAADAEYTKALQFDTRNAWAWHGLALLRAYEGRVPEAFEAIRRARELEPTMPLFNHNYGMLLYQSRRYDEAIAQANSLLTAQPFRSGAQRAHPFAGGQGRGQGGAGAVAVAAHGPIEPERCRPGVRPPRARR